MSQRETAAFNAFAGSYTNAQKKSAERQICSLQIVIPVFTVNLQLIAVLVFLSSDWLRVALLDAGAGLAAAAAAAF